MGTDTSEDKLHITFICEGIKAPSSRFRVKPVAKRFEEYGWRTSIIYRYGKLDSKIKNRFLQIMYRGVSRIYAAIKTLFVQNTDFLFVQRLSLPWTSLPERVVARKGIPVVFDFDDAIYLGSSRKHSKSRQRALRQIYKASSLTIAGNQYLARNSREYSRTEVIPTCIDVDTYQPAKNEKSRPVPVIGWMGTSSNYVELSLVADTIQKLREKGYDFKVKVVSDLKNDELIKKLDADFEYWSDEKELKQLQSFDIGLMPLRDIEWTKGKCSFKVIQYMAVGIPSVASKVGFNEDVITHGENGYLVSNDDEWFKALVDLMESEELRNEMGIKAREAAVNRFSVDKAAEKYHSLLKELL